MAAACAQPLLCLAARKDSRDGEMFAGAAFAAGGATGGATQAFWTHWAPQSHQVLLNPTRQHLSVQPTKVSHTKLWKKLTKSSAAIERSQATTAAGSQLTG